MWMKYSRVSQAFGGSRWKAGGGGCIPFSLGLTPKVQVICYLETLFAAQERERWFPEDWVFLWRRTFRVSIQRCQFNEIRHNPLLLCYLLFSAKKSKSRRAVIVCVSAFLLVFYFFLFTECEKWKCQDAAFSSTIFIDICSIFFCFALGSTALASNAVNFFYSKFTSL